MTDIGAVEEKIFGGILDVLANALKDLPNVKTPELPRMADFARIATAAEQHMGFKAGMFISAYEHNQLVSNKLVIESSPVGLAIQKLLENVNKIETTASKLLKKLEQHVESEHRHVSEWPRLPRQLSVTLRRIAPNLRGIGVDVIFPPRSANERKIILRKL